MVALKLWAMTVAVVGVVVILVVFAVSRLNKIADGNDKS